MTELISSIQTINYTVPPLEFETHSSWVSSLLSSIIPSCLGEKAVRNFLLYRKYEIFSVDPSFEKLWSDPIDQLTQLPAMENWVPMAHNENKTFEAFKRLRACYTMHSLRIKTPDGVGLSGALFQNCQHSQDECLTLIYFCGYGENFRVSDNVGCLLEMAMRYHQPLNVIAFDYRGCVESDRAKLNSSAIILDGLSLYHLAIDGLNISKEKICLYGFSLGGAVAHSLRHRLGQDFLGKVISDRSFCSYKKAVQGAIIFACNSFLAVTRDEFFYQLLAITASPHLASTLSVCLLLSKEILKAAANIGFPVMHWVGYLIASISALYIDLLKCELAPSTDWIPSDRVMIIEHENDPVIQPIARISHAITLTAETYLNLRVCQEYASLGLNHHCTPLNYHLTEEGMDPLEAIIDFMIA